ncbi:MAG TPA: tRNA uridine-5-carboxymethylaminomethyl(34) synthesis GTPase MnmE [Alphaproteobacteria bacterium]|nr:tRNA uridine-5-carboxymethylaminomethyl(34) synthesis GTPase MnmE [Alphaproteobacteria bacterium]
MSGEADPADRATRETIFALSSGAGRAGVAVIRVSGPNAGPALDALAGVRPAARHASLRNLRDPENSEPLDRALILWFPGPASVTGEDVAELHVHGGRAVIEGVIEALAGQDGLRPAEPGEFTRRAFENGLLDLTAAEGIADLVEAETAAQRRQAQRQTEGVLAALYDGWRERMVAALAHLEAAIDFSDEDLPEAVLAKARPALAELAEAIAAHLDDGHRGERLRDGITVAIVGAPNVGKSSLLNALARREVAIVAETAGTTRDVIEVHLDLDGYPVIVADTAGLRALDPKSADPVEAEGIRRARARAETADIRIVVFDVAEPANPDGLGMVDDRAVIAVNKIDLIKSAPPARIAEREALAISALSGAGIPALLERLAEVVGELLAVGSEAPALTRTRHRQALDDCLEALRRAERAELPELAAEDARLAVRALGRITGRVEVEDILDVIFRDFCIGK